MVGQPAPQAGAGDGFGGAAAFATLKILGLSGAEPSQEISLLLMKSN